MIKRKKKVIRVRRNPSKFDDGDYVRVLKNAAVEVLTYGRILSLTRLITLYNQDIICRDCDQLYLDCDCEKCDDCDQDRCVCRFLGNDEKPKDRIRIRKIAWEFIRYFHTIYSNFRYEDYILSRYDIDLEFRRKSITKSEADFLKALKPSSKFPKYTSLMKRLFEID